MNTVDMMCIMYILCDMFMIMYITSCTSRITYHVSCFLWNLIRTWAPTAVRCDICV